jgi:hypothetical protein
MEHRQLAFVLDGPAKLCPSQDRLPVVRKERFRENVSELLLDLLGQLDSRRAPRVKKDPDDGAALGAPIIW